MYLHTDCFDGENEAIIKPNTIFILAETSDSVKRY
jgi:hypothetical protein